MQWNVGGASVCKIIQRTKLLLWNCANKFVEPKEGT